MSKRKIIILGTALALASGSAFAAGDASKGAEVYKKKCLFCHPTNPGVHKMGPSLAAVFGRKAGTVPGYHKYKGLKNVDILWDEDNMDKWLANPRKFLGKKTSMVYKLKSAEKRTNVIEYMKGLK